MTQPEGGGGAAGATANPGGGGIPATLFTQEQVNHFNAEAKRTAVNGYFKELGLDKPPTGEELSAALTAAGEYQKLKDGEKTEVQRLTGELATANEAAAKVPSLEAARRRAELAGDAGLKSRYHKYVEGSTDEEIEASIKLVLADVGGGGSGSGEGGEQSPQEEQQQVSGRTGTGGTPPAPNPQQAAGGGGKPKSTMAAGKDAYKARHGEKE